jgi:hypothetical protein
MSQLKTKLLTSGCGITYSNQETKTWVNILKSIGVDIIDVAGPAVSNQWILNRAFLQLHKDPTIKKVVIQLTGMGTLDVSVDDDRFENLVVPDTKRNFVIDNVCHSSSSTEHESKALWREWLHSPELEQQDIKVKLLMLADYCNTHDIDCLIVQGYDLKWNECDVKDLSTIISDINSNIMDDYHQSLWYNDKLTNDVPVIEYQFLLAESFCAALIPEYNERLTKIKSRYFTN